MGPKQAPTIGRIVYFTMPDGTDRPAIITKVWNDQCVNLQVFLDGTNDDQNIKNLSGVMAVGESPALAWLTSVTWSSQTLVRSWHWPQVVSFTGGAV